MKRCMLLMAMLFVGFQGLAQDKLYLVFELMKVDNDQEGAYWETEEFWEKIHEQRVKNGDIIGWDLWRLQPGGEDQHYQYMTVNLYDDPVKMMSGAGDFDAAIADVLGHRVAEPGIRLGHAPARGEGRAQENQQD